MSENKYKAVFFDLDHTLWDYHTNSKETLTQLFDTNLPKSNHSTMELIQTFVEYNDEVWALYHKGHIEQSMIRLLRFKNFLNHFGWDSNGLAEKLSADYVALGPKQKNLLPGTVEILDYLQAGYRMSIITNGFETIQHQKVSNSGLQHYFEEIITSEKVGSKKPDPGIFEYALNKFEINSHEAIMIGDNLNTDIHGALKAGLDAVLFDPDDVTPKTKAHQNIASLLELKNIL